MSDPQRPPPSGGTLGAFFGGLLMVAGVLIATLCGACTAYFTIGFAVSAGSRPLSSGDGMVFLPIVLGGVPTLLGIGLFFLGRGLWRGR